MYNPKPKHCVCDKPFSDCPYATETPHGDKWYCELKTNIKLKSKTMAKGTIITGKQGTGKTTLALEMAKTKRNSIRVLSRNFDISLKKLCDMYDVVIIDEIRTIADLVHLTNSHEVIRPQLILVTSLDRKDFETVKISQNWEIKELH